MQRKRFHIFSSEYIAYLSFCGNLGMLIHPRTSTIDLSLIYKRNGGPSRILQSDWLRAAQKITQELEFYQT